ncbi:MAG: NAD kinase [Melioribacteraceae bacterium]|nr:MAG: NAD kinase [Melioribacteraceae bacterium]
MTIGIIPNTTKVQILEVVEEVIYKINEYSINYVLSDDLLKLNFAMKPGIKKSKFLNLKQIADVADIIISIGGDGTMLTTAYEFREARIPMVGLNLGKLGFLAEFDMNELDHLLQNIKSGTLIVDERIALEAVSEKTGDEKLFAINDLVIDKGRWPKMITLTLRIDKYDVTTFSADGIIIATPTGSTGYSLSAGGPIVSPKSDAITISPISPHTLTMRPLVISSSQKILVTVESQYESVQINCDGQRVHYFEPPFSIEIYKREKPIRLLHTNKTNYYQILRNKLLWGLDVRNKDK